MRDPNCLNKIDDYIDNGTIIVIDELPEFDMKDYDLSDEKEFKKYVKALKMDIRQSFEYREMVKFLKTFMNMDKCAFYQNVSNADSRRIKIHIHHDPLDLESIACIVYRKRAEMLEDLSIEAVGKEVMIIHYNFMVGLIPLAETVHELVHNQYLFVPTSKVMGHYRKFVEMYKPWMFPEQVDTLDRIEEASKFATDEYKTILGTNYIYMDLSGCYTLPNKQEIENMMRNTITKIREDRSKVTMIRPVSIIK